MASVVLDTSAVLAVVFNEPGSDQVVNRLNGALMSSVNVAEVWTKLAPKPHEQPALANLLAHMRIVDFDAAQAHAAGLLVLQTYVNGLSLGDRACIALAKRERAEVLTTDRAWRGLALGVKVRFLR